jgi:hypothetical protein
MTGKRGQNRGPLRVRLRRGPRRRGGAGDASQCGNLGGTAEGSTVTALRPEEPARFNPDMLESLCIRIGETRAEAEVARALDRISATVVALNTLSADADASLMAAALRSLIRDAELIGMTTLSRVGRDVLSCLVNDDRLAYAATLARLVRVGERSIHAVWDLEDLSG